LLNKLFINIVIIILSNFFSYTFANEPVDIWNIDKKQDEKIPANSNKEKSIDIYETVVIQDNLMNIIKEDEVTIKRKIVGLYDPEENGFNLEMWTNTDPKKIFELSKKINKMTLSEDAKNIYTKLLLTNSYSPIEKSDEKIFLEMKSDWLIKYKDIDLIKEYLKKNIELEPNEQLTKFVLDELLSINENKQACEFLNELNANFRDKYLTKFSIYCLVYLNKNEQASLRYDLEKELGYNDPFFEKKFQYLLGYISNSSVASETDLLNLHLSYVTNKEYKYSPGEKTPKKYWRYLSSNNLLESVNNIDIEDENQISLLEKATHERNYEEIDLLNLYKRFQFSVDQLLNIELEIKKISKIKSRALLYQGILLNKEPNTVIKFSKLLKESFENENIPNAFNYELKKLLKNFKLKELSSEHTKFYSKSLEEENFNNDIKFNNKILHQSKLVKYFSKDNISNKKIEKDLNNYLKKIKKSKKNYLITKDIILIEAMASDGIEIKEEYKNLYNTKESTIPTDIQVLINDQEIGMAILRLIEIIGQDKIKDLGSETLYFLINALNQMNIDPIRNEILFSVLPLRA
tara:strand:- start:484 stop:2211 length:1728 start_codon:yes stop_codon:yes gene_type:complete